MRPVRWRSTSLAVTAVLAIVTVSCRGAKPAPEQSSIPVPGDPSPPPRPVRPLPDQAFHVEWMRHDVPDVMKRGASVQVTVTFKNVSPLPWPDPDSSSYEPPVAGAVRLSYRWWPASSPTPSTWASRADLTRLLRPGQAATLTLPVTAPAAPGDYRLQIDLIQEMAYAFGDKGAERLMVPVRVG
jgi:hypothetical protein